MAVFSEMRSIVLVIAVLTISIPVISCLKPENRSYEDGEYIPLFANMLQPTLSRCEMYPYFSLPFCPPGDEIPNRKKSLDEILLSDCLTNTRYKLSFKEEKIGGIVCEKSLTKDEVGKFRNAIYRDLRFQLSFNNILMWGPVGKTNMSVTDPGTNYYLLKHIEFDAYYIEDKVKDIRLRTDFDSAVSITEDKGVCLNFTYSVFWRDWNELPVELGEAALLERTSMFKYQWPSAEEITSPDMPFFYCISVVFAWVASLVLVIEPYLDNYFNRNSNGEVEEAKRIGSGQIHRDVEEGRVQQGSKQGHGETCRCPPYSSLLGAFLGAGTQQLILICTFFILSYKGVLHICDEEQWIAYYMLMYCLTSAMSTYTATSFHSRYNATGWKECVFQTGALYFVPSFTTYMLMNYLEELIINFSNLPSFRTLVELSLTWGVVTILFLILGGKVGHVFRPEHQPLCPTNRIPRTVPRVSWYMRTPAQVFVGGFLPFMTIFSDMDYVYATLLHQKVCDAFRTMFLAFIQIIGMTVLMGMGFTYLQLSKHDHQWWWRSVLRGGSTSIFMFIYGIYFFVKAVPGDCTIVFALGTTACIFYGLFLALGTVGFCASSLVFRIMYRGSLKNE
ncbi:transmembrane 9 superfamily member 4-like [Actinidia eriantha]|uniref:transmembrane 9 superfamily member 4-like n=1 Tax=Actinidia eriantha TaxID=165200 RepID=UPI0025855F4A|nr:transmembrane 9 superfamily member 4-like [Actinidia eriantha]